MTILVPVVLGLALSAGLVLAVVAALRPAPMHITAAWHHLQSPTGSGGRARRRGVAEHIATWLQHNPHAGVRIPAADLTVLQLAPAAWVRRCLRGAGLGATTGALAGLTPTVVSGIIPVELAGFLSVAGAVAGPLLATQQLRERAARARHDATRALATYLELVAGERSAGQAPGPALSEAAALGEHWLFHRLAHCLAHAHRVGHTPWAALRELGEQLALPALCDVADLAETAADGAAVTTSLNTAASSLREQTRSTDRAAANAANERLTLPTSLMLLSLLLLVLYPTAAQLLHL